MATGISMDVFQWIVGGMFTLLMSVGGFFFKQISMRLKDIERDFYLRNERLSVVESQLASLKDQTQQVVHKLDAIQAMLLTWKREQDK
jgi:hypothetical protein